MMLKTVLPSSQMSTMPFFVSVPDAGEKCSSLRAGLTSATFQRNHAAVRGYHFTSRRDIGLRIEQKSAAAGASTL